MKIFLSLVFSIVVMLNFTACGSSSSNNNTDVGNENVSDPIELGFFAPGEYGDIIITTDWSTPDDALFLDIRNDWERVQIRAVGTVGGAIYEYREPNSSERSLNSDFYADVLALAGSEHREIILICHSGSRTAQAAQYLSDNGFTNIWDLLGGIDHWGQVKPSETIRNTPL